MLTECKLTESEISKYLFNKLKKLGFNRKMWRPGDRKQVFLREDLYLSLKEYDDDVEIFLDTTSSKYNSLKYDKYFSPWEFYSDGINKKIIDKLIKDIEHIITKDGK